VRLGEVTIESLVTYVRDRSSHQGRSRQRRKPWTFLIGAGLALGLTGRTADAAQAQTGTIPAEEEGTVVASTRTGGRTDGQAVPIAVVGRDHIEAGMLRAPGDILTLFNGMPGLRMQTTSPVLGTTILRMQGLPGQYTRLLLDGVHLYGDRPGGYTLPRIPPMDLDRAEIIKGPASAFYGSDSLAGAVNLLSRKPGKEPSREFLFSQSARNATDGVLWISSLPTGSWSRTFLAGGHRQEETDVDHDGWSDVAGYARGAVRQRVFWDNQQGRSAAGVAGVTFETREGGSAFARESLETKTADGGLSGEMMLENGSILAGAGSLFVQSRTRDFSDGREHERHQSATLEITLRGATTRHTWLAGIAADWYAIRSDGLPSGYVSTRPGIFVHDDLTVAPWLVVSGSARLDHHNLYGLLWSPRGSALVRGGRWAARLSAGQGYFTPRPLTEETEAAGLARLTIEEPLEVDTARNVSADLTHTTRATRLTLSVFRSKIDDPAQIDRATYTLRTETEPIVTRGVEVLGRGRRGPFSVIGTYTYVRTRQHGGRELALTPRHSAGLIAAAEAGRSRIGVEVLFTGEQQLDANPYRSTSEPYVVVGLLGEHRVGRWRVFVNADNLTDVRQTNWDPIARPARDVDGRWTVDAWAPLDGRVINAGIRVSF
jgi:iron complex outermembrane receptor protein